MAHVSHLNTANLLTLSRILLLPLFFSLCLYAYRDPPEAASQLYHRLCVAIFFAILATDFADGHIARRRGQVTALGSLLDPLADKLLVTTSFLLLAAFEQIPAWLATIVVSKDLLVLIGWGLLFIVSRSAGVNPSRVGKACAVVQYATICAILLQLPQELNRWFFWPATAGLTVIAFIGYALDAIEQANHRNTE